MAISNIRVLSLCAILGVLLSLSCGQEPSITEPGATTTSIRPIFTVPVQANIPVPVLPNIKDPKAVQAQDICPGYTASNVVRTPYGLTAELSLAGPACNAYGTDVDFLSLTVEYQSSDRLHVEIVPTYVDSSNISWYILPEALVPKPAIDVNSSSYIDTELEFAWSNDPNFSFRVIRKKTGDAIFDTTDTKLVFENQFIEFASFLPENYNIYGLGEVIHGLRMGNNFTRTLWAADAGDAMDRNIYGGHPFYMDTRYYQADEITGNWNYAPNGTNTSTEYVSYSHGVYLRNSHGQEVLLQPSSITWRSLGGSIDLYFFAGPTQDKITRAYQISAVGLPAMQPYFSFGFHQCRWGYANWSEVQDVVDRFRQFEIPLETIWTDIDYMNQYRNFENDQNTFSYVEGAKFLAELHANGQHYIPIVDSAIYIPNPENVSDVYLPFTRGNASDSFLLNPDGSLYIGEVWPGYTVFPDWIGAVLNGTGAFDWWTNELNLWHQKISFDGIWIDMSEISSFCVGSCGSKNLTLNPVHSGSGLPGEPGHILYGYPEGFDITNATEYASVSSAAAAAYSSVIATSISQSSTSTTYLRTIPTPGSRSIEYPPYVLNNVFGALDGSAASPNATHHGGTQEYDYHNLFGHQILNATFHALLSILPGKRPFIIGRSTFAGSGKWAGHWGGDNTSLWAYMFFSIPQALSFSLFGIPMFGVDTCGFAGNTDEELCNRWMQLSAFFPFYRNHNQLSAIPQEPYRWASVASASKKAMAIRYALLPYIYTTFYQAHSTGSTVLRALAWEFPNEPLLASADRQFLLGPSLLITPVLVQGATNVSGVFPGAGKGEVWYDWYTHTAMNSTPGENVTIPAPLGHIPVFIRGGSILPLQEPGYTIKVSRQNPWALIVALSLENTATGVLYVDDGESIAPGATLWVEFALVDNALSASPRGTYHDVNPLSNITVLGVMKAVKDVMLNGNVLPCWTYDDETKVLEVRNLHIATAGGAWTRDWVLMWD